MKVLMIMHDDDTYGAPKSMVKLAELLYKQYAVHPIVITPKDNKVNAQCEELGIENYAIGNWRYYVNRKRYFFEPAVNFLLNHFFDLTFYKKIAKVINFDEIDIIHSAVSVVSHGHELSKKYHLPHVWHLRELDPYQYYFTKDQIEDMSNSARAFISISNVVKEYWTNVGLDSTKIHTIYNGIDKDSIAVKEDYATKKKLKIVLAGRINPDKRVEVAIAAINKLEADVKENVELSIYGNATKMFQQYYQELKDMVAQYKLEKNVFFKGYESNVNQLLSDYDVALMNSKAEPFGRTTVEYMFAGLAVLASNTGANEEIITDGVNGIIYQESDSNQLAEKLTYLYEHREEIERLGKEARKTAMDNFTAEQNAKNVYELYLKVLRDNE